MKYMGSKRWMLQNGLGTLLRIECAGANRFVDLFAGSGAVACFVAVESSAQVIASDLQEFSVVLSRAIIGRETALNADRIWAGWSERAERLIPVKFFAHAARPTKAEVSKCREWCQRQKAWPYVRAYGGH